MGPRLRHGISNPYRHPAPEPPAACSPTVPSSNSMCHSVFTNSQTRRDCRSTKCQTDRSTASRSFLSALLKAGVVAANATPTGASAASKELAMSMPKSADSSDAVVSDYRDDILSETINLNYLDFVRYVASF